MTLGAALHREIFLPDRARAPPASGSRSPTRCSSWATLVRRPRDGDARPRLPAAGVPRAGRRAGARPRAGDLRALADELRMPEHIWHTHALRGMRALLDGDLEAAERLAEEARRAGERAEQPLAHAVLRDPADPDPQPAGPRRRAAARGPRAGRALPGHPRLAHGADQPRRPLGRRRAGPARAGAVRGRRLRRDPAGRQLAAGDEPDGRGDRADRRPRARRAALRGAAALRGPGDRRRPRRRLATGPVDRVLGLLARTVRPPRRSRRHLEAAIEIATRMGDRPGMALCRVELAEVLLERGGDGDRERALELLAEALGPAREMGARGDRRPRARACASRRRAWRGWT